MKIFEDPKMEVVQFEAEDIITTSGGGVEGDSDVGGAEWED